LASGALIAALRATSAVACEEQPEPFLVEVGELHLATLKPTAESNEKL
jgi:hypothetical protein